MLNRSNSERKSLTRYFKVGSLFGPVTIHVTLLILYHIHIKIDGLFLLILLKLTRCLLMLYNFPLFLLLLYILILIPLMPLSCILKVILHFSVNWLQSSISPLFERMIGTLSPVGGRHSLSWCQSIVCLCRRVHNPQIRVQIQLLNVEVLSQT